MTARTRGDLCGLTVRDESTYGEIGTGASAYAGTTLTLSTTDAFETADIQQCGSRVSGGTYRTSASYGYTATFNHVRGQNWQKWMRRALGALTGAQRDIPSFTTGIRVAPEEVHVFTGCKVNSLQISGSAIGQALEFSVTAVARWHTMTPLEDVDGSPLTFDTVAIPTGVPITFSKPWEYSTDGSQFTRIPGKSFTLQVNQNLSSNPSSSGDSDDAYQLEAGDGSAPQDLDITLSIVITSVGPDWDRLRLAFTSGLTFRTVIDGHTVTCKGCTLDPDMPDRSQGTYDETISLQVADIEVS